MKSLLEQSTIDNADNVVKLPNVLFIGDSYTKSKSSYANQLIKNKVVDGRIVAWANINIKNLVKLLKRYITPEYSVVSVMFGDIIVGRKIGNIELPQFKSQLKELEEFKSQLKELETAARLHGAQLVLIENPANQYIKYLDYLAAISDNSKFSPDATISVANQLNSSNTQSKIAKSWINSVKIDLNIDVPDVDVKTLEKSIDQEKTDADRIPAERAPIPNSAKEFINQWSSIAKEHQTKYGIPASITLAQGGLESAWGKSRLATDYNNYFGITGKYKGKSINLRDSGGSMLDFRVYSTPEESYEDHAQLLKRKYTPKSSTATYVEWANTLQQNGYATDHGYADSLIKIIEKFGLNDYDSANQTVSTKLGDIIKNNNILGAGKIHNGPISIRSGFGPRKGGMHYGIDFIIGAGTPIYMAMAGKIIRADGLNKAGYGNVIYVKHEDGTVTRYGHMSRMDVSTNMDVAVGDLIGLTGGVEGAAGAGNSTGPHLHWEYLPDGGSAKDGASVYEKYFATKPIEQKTPELPELPT